MPTYMQRPTSTYTEHRFRQNYVYLRIRTIILAFIICDYVFRTQEKKVFDTYIKIIQYFSAMSWPPEDGYSHHARDFYDFRSSNWFVEAATSPKDLVILLDDSDDLSSSYWRLAKATVSGLLDTLGPNDFVNVYRYSDTVSEIHSCYTKILAQVCVIVYLLWSLL